MAELNNYDVHVWKIDLSRTCHCETDVAEGEVVSWQSQTGIPTSHTACAPRNDTTENVLSIDEMFRADRFKFPEHRERFIAAHNALRKILGSYLNVLPQQLEFAVGSHGKPYLKNHPELQFNLSHSHEFALCAVNLAQPIGVDVEYMKKDIEPLMLAKRFFAPIEYDYLKALLGEKLDAEFFTIWTRKEAVIKMLGEGLSHPLDKFSVLDGAENPWVLQAITVPEAYVASLALPSGAYKVSCRDYY